MSKNTRDGMKYEDVPLSKTKKSGIRVVSEMSNLQIALYFIQRNGYPLSVMTNLALVGDMIWTHVVRPLFF